MTPHETLVALIRSQLPRLQGWEIEGLAKVIVEAGYGVVVNENPRHEIVECPHGYSHIYPDVCYDPDCPLGIEAAK